MVSFMWGVFSPPKNSLVHGHVHIHVLVLILVFFISCAVSPLSSVPVGLDGVVTQHG